MKEKISTSITKFVNLEVNIYQAAVYYNVCMIKSVFFGCRVINLAKKQKKELERLYEESILRKIGFSTKFPRNMLYSRKLVLGIGLIEPHAIIDTMKLQLYIGNKEKGGNTA